MLSILIPTFNRPHELEATVRVIRSQIENSYMRDSVEVLIGDNSDSTNKALVTISNTSYIRYMFHARNLGQANNIHHLIRAATGTFVWLLSDDDLIHPSAIEQIFAEIVDIEKNCIPVNFLTFFVGDNNSTNLWIKDKETTFWQSGEKFLNNSWEHPIFISDNILRRETVLQTMDTLNLWDRKNDTYQNSAISFSVIFLKGGVRLIPRTLINDTWTPKLYMLDQGIRVRITDLMKLKKLFQELGMKPQTLRLIRLQILRNLFSWIVICQLCSQGGLYTRDNPPAVKTDQVSRIDAAFLLLFNSHPFFMIIRRILCYLLKLVRPGLYENALNEFNKISENIGNPHLFQTYDE